MSYPERLKSIGITLLSPFTRAKDHHRLRCDECQHEWSATPISKLQSNEKRGGNGCPACHERTRQAANLKKRAAFISKKPDHIDILSPYDGQQGKGNATTVMDHVHFRNNRCGHDFWTVPVDVIRGRVDCPVCGKRVREAKRDKRNKQAHIDAKHDKWSEYKSAVTSLTRKAYIEYQQTINPHNLPIGLAGVEGAYQLDHIIPRRVGFDLGIPPELISHPDNLQMLPWHENRAHGVNIKHIPSIFQEYKHLLEDLCISKMFC